ncbi:MAG: SDR family oxidoreductase [Bacteroidales bacterium]|nr:SDR family oxidoreductase [Bacteroidales bacterium]MCF8344582.1 SDR family oxidoreductase [Bacteroidales bacterium]MCF8349600.1 SDR family oxidoreductase [Bacteroidales bacterium]MCF8376041.1 SDR family oxidoreductase [Bacteroidales bacterium]MCF8400426.1 SDR family oxidoreductase [Bacteroidales bacterium]
MQEKVIVITGASSGIGRALALEYASEANRIVLAARNMEKLEKLSTEIKKKGKQVLAVQTDVSVENDCKNLILKSIEAFGKIDVLINNAGISMRALFEDSELDVIRKLMDVNFWGTVYCTKYALPYLLKSKGSVVGVSSIGGYKGLPGRTGYSASKFAMHGFLETLRIENLKKGLHVLIACPGFTATNIRNTALNKEGKIQGESPRDEDKMMSAEEVAKYIRKAVKKRKRSLTLTTQGKTTVLLNKFFPGMLDKMVYNHMAKEPDSPFK